MDGVNNQENIKRTRDPLSMFAFTLGNVLLPPGVVKTRPWHSIFLGFEHFQIKNLGLWRQEARVLGYC